MAKTKYGWVDPTTGKVVPTNTPGSVYSELDSAGKYATQSGLRAATSSSQQSPVNTALNTWDWRKAIGGTTPNTTSATASNYDQISEQIASKMSRVISGNQTPSKQPITSGDVMTAQSSGSPAAADRNFYTQIEYNSPDNQAALEATGGDRPAYTIAPEHVADYIAAGGQGRWDLSNPGAPAYRGGNLPYTMVNGQPVQWGAVPTGGDPSIGALDNAKRSVNSFGQQVVKPAGGGTAYSGAGPSHGLDDAKQFINDRGQNTYQFPDGGTATSEKPKITNPIKADWPELPKSPIAQNDRNDLNNMLNQSPETQFLAPSPSPPPRPTPTPSPEPAKKEDESYV